MALPRVEWWSRSRANLGCPCGMWALERRPQTCCRLIPKSSWIRCFPDPQQSVKTSLETDQQHLRRALELAQQSFGLASPNPNVGAVVVDTSGQAVGEGF